MVLCNCYVSAYTFDTWLMPMGVLLGPADTDKISDDFSMHSYFVKPTIKFCLTYGLWDFKIVVN